MKSGALEAIERVVIGLENKATVAEIAANIDEGDAVEALAETASLLESIASAAGKKCSTYWNRDILSIAV